MTESKAALTEEDGSGMEAKKKPHRRAAAVLEA